MNKKKQQLKHNLLKLYQKMNDDVIYVLQPLQNTVNSFKAIKFKCMNCGIQCDKIGVKYKYASCAVSTYACFSEVTFVSA